MDAATLRCRTCGATVEHGPFCIHCGSRVGMTTCPVCAKGVVEHATFCDGCGAPLLAPHPLPFSPAAYPANGAPPAGPAGRQPIAWAPRGTRTGYSPPTSLHGSAGSPASRARAAMRATGVTSALAGVNIALMATVGWAVDRNPAGETAYGVSILLTWVLVWLLTALWVGNRAGGGWGAAFFLLPPLALPLYVYRSARAGYPARRPRFPAVWSFSAFTVVGLLVCLGAISGEAEATDDRTPYASRSALSIADGTPVAADGDASYDPYAMWAALLEEPVLADEYPGDDVPDPWSDYEDAEELEWWGLRVYHEAELGDSTFIVCRSDAEAAEWLGPMGQIEVYVLPEEPSLPAQIARRQDGSVSIWVVVGNVLVYVESSPDHLEAGGVDSGVTPEDAAKQLAAAGARRLLRLGGEPDREPGDFV